MANLKFADLHLHVSLKHYINDYGNIWQRLKYDPSVHKPNRAEADDYMQSDVSTLIEAGFDVAVVALYPFEDISYKKLIGRIASKLIFGLNVSHMKKLVKKYKTKFELLKYELDFVTKRTSIGGKYKFVIPKNRSDFNEDITNLVLSIEGGHALRGETLPENDPDKFLDETIQNLIEVKKWEYPVFSLTLCHFQYNYLAGQSWAVPLPGIIRSNKLDKELIPIYHGITPLGEKVIEVALDETIGNGRILIDIKHLHVEARQQYYRMLETNPKYKNVPIIVSHCGVSGINHFHEYQQVDVRAREVKEPQYEKFYPMEINLCNDDIRKIYKLGGIIGIIVDQRILGGSNDEYERLIKTHLKNQGLKVRAHWQNVLFFEAICHIVTTIGNRDAWNMICMGSDYDGIIDPIQDCPTALYYKSFEQKLIRFAEKYYLTDEKNRNDFKTDLFLDDDFTIEVALRKVFHTNAVEFVKKHFPVP